MAQSLAVAAHDVVGVARLVALLGDVTLLAAITAFVAAAGGAVLGEVTH